MTIKPTVHVHWELDGTVSYTVILESGAFAASGSHQKPRAAARDIGSAFLLEADQ